jgi:hypothetical protein
MKAYGWKRDGLQSFSTLASDPEEGDRDGPGCISNFEPVDKV